MGKVIFEVPVSPSAS